MPALIGLTGGIASGKSTVSRFFTQLGAHVIDADLLAREVVAPGSAGLAAIRERFGPSVISDRGELDRERLGQIVFAEASARRDLEAITHPRIALMMAERAEHAERELGHSWVIYDAALIVERGLHRALQGLIVVACARDTQLERLMARDRFTREQAAARLDAQLPLEEKIKVADHIIDNDGSLDHTRSQALELFERYETRYALRPSFPR